MNKSLTIVLPVHNGESRLERSVNEIIELASELTDHFSILIIDDGSTDDTLEVAGEIAARFPQVSFLRERTRRGLGPMMERISHRIQSDVVMVHDGVTPIDAHHVRQLWHQCHAGYLRSEEQSMTAYDKMMDDLRELQNLPATHASLAQAHQRVMGFHAILANREDSIPQELTLADSESLSDTKHHQVRQGGVGNIPPLPRPNFLTTIAEFATGE